jgi:hypothetical protein
MNWFKEHVEKPVAQGLEHSLDHTVNILFAAGKPQEIEATINHFIETSPLVKLLGMFGTLVVTAFEGEIDSIITHNSSPDAIAKIKAEIHQKLLIK